MQVKAESIRGPATMLVLGVVVLVLAATAHAAQSPFGIATPDGGSGGFGGPLAPIFGWIAARQAEFYRELTTSLVLIKESYSAAWLLLGLSFAYGVFHAAGPGHGKAVITSYLIASGDRIRRGIVLSFAAAFVQAAVAVALVAIASMVFRATALTMTGATDWLEIASYALIVMVGAWLLWTKALNRGSHHHHHDHILPGGDEGRSGRHPVADGQDPKAHGENATPRHGSIFVRPTSAVVAVGIRPCSGAIIVLVYALSQGLFAVGVAATFFMALGTGLAVALLAILATSAKGLAVRLASAESNLAGRITRGIEIGGAGAVLLFGLFLLGGALSAGWPN